MRFSKRHLAGLCVLVVCVLLAGLLICAPAFPHWTPPATPASTASMLNTTLENTTWTRCCFIPDPYRKRV